MKAYYYDGPVMRFKNCVQNPGKRPPMPRQKRKLRAILLIGIKKKTA